MADAELTKALKDLSQQIHSSSVKYRKEVIKNVINVLSDPGVNETIVKGIIRQIQLTTFRYSDGKSLQIVRALLVALLEKHPESAIKCLLAMLADVSAQFKQLIATPSICQNALNVLHWSTLLLNHGWKVNSEQVQKNIHILVEAQANLISAIAASGCSKLIRKAFNTISASLLNVKESESIYLKAITDGKLELSAQIVVLVSIVIKHLQKTEKLQLIDPYKVQLLDAFIKNYVSCKTRPSSQLITACHPLLEKVVDSELFDKTLLPAIQKAMLRNPEVILEAVGIILAGLQLDLSPWATAIGNSFISNLHSKNDQTRSEACSACKMLAMKLHQAKVVEQLLKKTFDVFHGSDGKLTVVDYKISVLLGAGSFSYNKVADENTKVDELNALMMSVVDLFIKVLEVEVHEKTLCTALDMLSQWWANCPATVVVPKKLFDFYKKGMGLKTSTPPVKIAYIQSLWQLITRGCAGDDAVGEIVLEQLSPLLLKSVENAVKQPTQPLLVTEGLCAAICLIKLSQTGCCDNLKENFQFMWNACLDMDKQTFVSDKFISTASDDVAIYLMEFCCQLLQSDKIIYHNKYKQLYRAILHSIISTSSTVRLRNLKTLQNLLQVDRIRNDVVTNILNELQGFLEKSPASNTSSSNKSKDENETLNAVISQHAVVALITTTVGQQTAEIPLIDKQQLLLEALLPAHHPLVVQTCANLWLKVVKHLKVDAKSLVAQQRDQIRKKFIENYQVSPTFQNALATLLSANGDILLPDVLNKVYEYLNDPKICQISRDDYFVYLTPEGELYDKSVLPGGDQNNLEMNLKRESKTYSYKEQLEELQLRREIEEKQRKEGKLKPPQYTPKQLEAIKNQKAKEQAIRQRLSQLDVVVKKAVSMINSSIKGNSTKLSEHFKNLLPVMLQCLQSPLAAPSVAQLFKELRLTVFEASDPLAELIAHLTLRLSHPQCDLDANWEAENVNKAMVRALNTIHSRTDTFTVTAFAYIFPFLTLAIMSNHAKNHNELIAEGLQVIEKHVKLRGPLNRPHYLPTKQIITLLVDIISNTTGRIQSQAAACLLTAATCLNAATDDDEDACRASVEEIDILFAAIQNESVVVRDAALRSLLIIAESVKYHISLDSEYFDKCSKRIWIAKFDENEDNCDLAEKLWQNVGLNFASERIHNLLEDIEHPVEAIQRSAARALAALLSNCPENVPTILEALLKLYNRRLEMIPEKLDEFGRKIDSAIDVWLPRNGVALALAELAPLIKEPELIGHLVEFFVNCSLSDRNETVRQQMLNAALKIVDLHGKDNVGTLWTVFDNFMAKSTKSSQYDAVKQAVVILMGSLARHLTKDDERIKPIVARLIQALSTPSQTVQEAVANCLPPLVPCVREEAPGYVNKLLHQLLKGDKYGERKGAAYGLAGLVKGMGIMALKQHDIMAKLTDAIQDKKNYKHREGALFAFEMLFQMLGKLFEPYIVHVLPHLLQCFGDTSQYVRTAADDTAKVVMSKLTGHGVKLVLPSLLEALEEDSWRTKTGSVELLGAMAYCAPKQLSSCLPSIVPKLIEVLSDSHMKVQEAGADALKVIGSVIRNPEIQAIVPVLLKALQDPSNKTSVCLQTLLDTQFVHFIDAPSLALIMPVVQRAFMDRSTETRKMAAQIIGNMYSLTDQKDLMPYLPTIIPGLKMSLLDPVPEVRSVSARALGAMVKGMGESSFEDLLPWLMQTLTSETSSVDRSGAAQGLSEVVGGLGVTKLHKLMPEVISTAERTDIAPHVKDGYIMMFIYMPAVFTHDFTPYIGQIINPILKALADENEYVRETALKAGQRIVTLYADSAIQLLLPELEKGLFDDNWRIRYSSVQLLGDLLYRISGVTGKMSTETASEDDNFGTEQSHHAIINSLGSERRNRVLAGLYMGRSDVALMVRQSALHVWKVVVTNTPRTLREILPTLFGLLLGCLASDSYDKRQVAARTLGDLVRKLGERVLPEIIPILEEGLKSPQPDQRQGVCIGLSEIMASTSRDMVLTFVNSLVPTVRRALCDPLPEVRHAAAKTFDSLHSTVGARALDDILPALLNQLNSDDPEVVECTLDGLRQVMAIKSRVVLPYLVPQLTSPPANTKALSILASVAGEALNKYLPRILPALQTALAASRGTPEEAMQLEYCQAVVLSVMDDTGVRTIIDSMLENTRHENADQRRAAATLLCVFCAHSKAQYTAHISQLLRGLIHLCTDSDRDVLQMAWEALNAVTKTLDAKQQQTYVSDVRQAVRYAMADMPKGQTLLPGFCIPKGVAPILPIFREAILNGDGDEKEAAAQGLGEVIRVTSAEALQPSVVAITGPLIRILGDRFSANVKTAVLETLAILLEKVGIMLKQFLPQLQTTFVKALNDPNRMVRLKAAAALSHLIVIHQRADPLFSEMHNTIKTTEDLQVKETTLHALRGIITPAGDKMSPTLKDQINFILMVNLNSADASIRKCAAGCLGALCKYLPPNLMDVTINEQLLKGPDKDEHLMEARAAALSVTLKETPETLWENEKYRSKLLQIILNQLSSSVVEVVMYSIRCCGYLFKYLMLNDQPLPTNLLAPFVRTMNHSVNDVKSLLVRVSIYLARNVPVDKMAQDLIKLLLPTLVNGTKEKNTYVKANSELALIAVLKLREGDATYQQYLTILDLGARESLSDVVTKVLKKILHQPEGKDDELDDTLLT